MRPPYSITPDVLSRVEEIGEAIGRAEAAGVARDLRLRRINRIRTIQGSLAIEGNVLSERQVATILDGKPVVAPLRDVQEVRNAIQAYDAYERWAPASEADLLNAHAILMAGLLDAPGNYRRGDVAVMGQGRIHHVGPPASRVPQLMTDLLAWLGNTREHPLIASSVFHYEFEFIHPFEDGNGRLGRLWQTLILTRWRPLFAHVPVESLVHASQSDYYDAIRESSARGESTPFIAFMLDAVLAAIAPPPRCPPCEPPSRAPVVLPDRGDVAPGNPAGARAERPQVATGALPVAGAAARIRGDDPTRRAQRQESEVPPDAAGAPGAVGTAVRHGRALARTRAGIHGPLQGVAHGIYDGPNAAGNLRRLDGGGHRKLRS